MPLAASLAKVYCSQAYSQIAGSNIQVHGGIGFTWEHPAQLYFKRAKASEAMFGTPAYHRERLAVRLGLHPMPARPSGGVSDGHRHPAGGPAVRRRRFGAGWTSIWSASSRQHRGVGGPDDSAAWDVRLRWEKELSAGRWLGLTWPPEYGGRGATLAQAIIFEYDYARAQAPYRLGVQGQDLFGPTLLMFGTPEQKARFLPKILAAEEFWGQGFSEPDAGSDLASVRTQARLVNAGSEWVIDGQKIWMTFGASADWLYVLCRTDPRALAAPRACRCSWCPLTSRACRSGRSPTCSATGEFCEVFFTGARTRADLVVGAPGRRLEGGHGGARRRARHPAHAAAARLRARGGARCCGWPGPGGPGHCRAGSAIGWWMPGSRSG